MNKYNITIFEDKHRTQVIDLWEKCNLIKSWNDPNKDIDRKLKVNDNLFLIVEFNKVIIGSAMIGYDGHRGSLYYLAVDPKHQRKGVGKMLMKEIEKRLIEVGCPKINIFIRNSNIEVKEFYQSIDYEEQDCLVYGKRLIPDL
ncbi:MAG: Acetyltransferase YpeA [Alphaproteobacteria bacterium MarineAlpha5_Bin1]|nr:MAG: Acetyltransferase YpeA [Alphaproteobacteria bacterium MarineAlpha5_Bin1]